MSMVRIHFVNGETLDINMTLEDCAEFIDRSGRATNNRYAYIKIHDGAKVAYIIFYDKIAYMECLDITNKNQRTVDNKKHKKEDRL